MAADLPALESQARRAYEWARVRRAAWGVVPLGALVLAAGLLGSRTLQVAVAGVLLLAVASTSLWAGRGFQRSLVPGVLAGLVPLALVTCAAKVGHHCDGATCRSLCLSASLLGGAGAGAAVGLWAVFRTAPLGVMAAAAAGALLTGALGCSCVGLTGLAALASSFLTVGGALAAFHRLTRPKEPPP